MKNKFLIVAVLIIVLGGLWFFASNKKEKAPELNYTPEQTETETTPETNTYTSDTYAFSFSYPTDIEVKEYTIDRISVGESTANGFRSYADVSLFTASPDTEAVSYEQFALDQARLSCAADGPNETWNCLEIEDLKSFSSKSGLTGISFFLILEKQTLSSGETEKVRRGPYYAFNTSVNTLGTMSAVIINVPISETETAYKTSLTKSIAESFSLSERKYR